MFRLMKSKHAIKGQFFLLAPTPEVGPALDAFKGTPRGKRVPVVGIIAMASPDIKEQLPVMIEPCYWTPGVAIMEPDYILKLAMTWAEEWQKPVVHWQQGVYGGQRGWVWPKSWTAEQCKTYETEQHEADRSPVFVMEVDELAEPLRSIMPILREFMQDERPLDFEDPVID